MREAMFPWVTADDCAACKKFPHFSEYDYASIPTDFDWRQLGAVGEVLNQKYCGSCWSFSTAQDIQGAHYLATGEKVIEANHPQSCRAPLFLCRLRAARGGRRAWLCGIQGTPL